MSQDFKLRRIGIIGLGMMGTGIAQVAATAGYEVRALDIEKTLVDRAVDRISDSLQKMIRKNLIQETDRKAILARIEASTDLSLMGDRDLIIEAVHEDREIKKALFRRLDQICSPETLFASNTSTIALTGLIPCSKRAERFLGLHFFNPVPVMKLVEVVKTAASSEEMIEQAVRFVESPGKKPVLVRDQAGFLVNYLLTPYLFDGIRSLSSGLAPVNDIDAAMRHGCGHPMGPLALCDLIGLDTLVNAGNILFEEYRESRYAPPPLLKRLVDLGDLGKKSGRGFYDYSDQENPRPRDLVGF